MFFTIHVNGLSLIAFMLNHSWGRGVRGVEQIENSKFFNNIWMILLKRILNILCSHLSVNVTYNYLIPG